MIIQIFSYSSAVPPVTPLRKKMKLIFVAAFLLGTALERGVTGSVAPKNADWWENTVFYQIYPRSFKDSDGDGIGDIKGVAEKVEYLKDLGIGAVWLSPVFKSPMVDFGYDISDYRDISPIFGTMADFDALAARLKQAGLKLIVDFVPNHSSDQHEWFQKSISKEDPYTDYYVWHDGKINENGTRVPPSNWVSNFGGSAWTWNENRQQYYLHQFGWQQPDLNFRNPNVVREMKDILKFWIDKGVDGFRMDAVSHMFEDQELRDESPRAGVEETDTLPDEFTYHDHIYMLNQPESYAMVREWRVMFDELRQKDGIQRIIMTEIQHNSTIQKTVAYYGNESFPLAHVPFNFKLFHLNRDSNANDFINMHKFWLDNMPKAKGMVANWIWGNHDNERPASRFYRELIDGINMLGLLVPGVAIVYNGDEIGMTDTYIRWDQTIDPMAFKAGPTRYRKWSRDGCRTPFQWDTSVSAGFSTHSKTQLPVNPNYWVLNAKQQMEDRYSNLKVFKKLVELKKKQTFKKGDYQFYALTDWLLAFTRKLDGFSTYAVVINLGSDLTTTKGLAEAAGLPSNLTVIVPSVNSGFESGQVVETDNVLLRPKASLVLSTGGGLSTLGVKNNPHVVNVHSSQPCDHGLRSSGLRAQARWPL
nr:PREDICTED: maltase A1-like isoform X1 [Bemisia tabaci]